MVGAAPLGETKIFEMDVFSTWKLVVFHPKYAVVLNAPSDKIAR
jgi:hypothetical protein